MDGLLRACVAPGPRRLRDFELLAYYYFDRVLNEVKKAEVKGMQPHHRKFFRYMHHTSGSSCVPPGTNSKPTSGRDWPTLLWPLGFSG